MRKEVMVMSDYREVFRRKEIKYILNTVQFEGIMDFLESMAVNFPALSIEWLITGKGKMYRGGDPLSAEENASGLFSLSCPADKIDRIVVFFSDGTYKEFR